MTKHTLILILLMLPAGMLAAAPKMSSYELGRKIMAFHDSYQEIIAETCDEVVGHDADARTRAFYQGVKVMYTQASLDIASASDAAEQLLDMVVMLRLQRLVWSRNDHGKVGTQGAQVMSEALRIIENQLHKIARMIFSQEDLNMVLSMTENWKKKNPDRRYVAFVRFTDIDDSHEKARIQDKLASGGLFSTISETNVEIEESRHLLEKALFVSHHMPILLEWQSELFLYRMLATSEIRDMITQTERTTVIAEGLLKVMEKLPADIDKILGKNKNDILQLSSAMEATSVNLRAVADQLSPLLAEPDEASPDSLAEIQTILTSANQTAQTTLAILREYTSLSYNPESSDHIAGLAKNLLQESDQLMENQMLRIDERLRDHRQVIFQMLLALTFLFPVVFFTGYVLAKKFTK
jgi:hypothetical protein